MKLQKLYKDNQFQNITKLKEILAIKMNKIKFIKIKGKK